MPRADLDAMLRTHMVQEGAVITVVCFDGTLTTFSLPGNTALVPVADFATLICELRAARECVEVLRYKMPAMISRHEAVKALADYDKAVE